MNKKFYLFFAALCCAFTFLLPQKAQAGQVMMLKDGVYYGIIDDGDKTGYVTYQRASDQNYSALSGDVYIASEVNNFEITRIGWEAFAYKKNGGMINIILPSSIKTIEARAFLVATKLYSIQLNEGLTKMEISVFNGCSSLTSVYFPSTLKEIPKWAFVDCTSLPAVALSSGVEHIGDYAFERCTALQSVKGQNGVNSVKTIGEGAFLGCTTLSDMRFSNGLTSIGEQAFLDCKKLENVSLAAKVSTIGEYAFARTGLKTFTVAWTSPLSIQANVFNGVDLSKCILYVPAGTKEAYKNANVWKKFGYILEPGETPEPEVTPDPEVPVIEPITTGDKKIGDLWYKLQGDLTATLLRNKDYKSLSGAITVPATVTYGSYTYTVDNMEAESDGIFLDCKNISSVTLPQTITEIQNHAFEGCTGLTKITFSSALTKIGYQAFKGCTALSNISMPASLTELGMSAFYGCSSLTSISIPTGVKIVYDWCFRGCGKLSSVTLSEGLTKIHDYAFAECTALKTLVLPASLSYLGPNVFNGSSNMVSLRSLRETPPTASDNTFNNMPLSTCILYVPQGTKSAYAAATGWKNFTNIEEKGLNTRIKYGKLYYQLEEDGKAYVTYETKDENNYKDLSGVITVEDKVIFKGFEYKVYAVGDSALMNCKGITKVNLPLIMDRIRGYAFGGCTNLAEINIPTTVSFLMSTAFDGTKLFNDNIDADGAVYYDGCMLYGPNKTYAGAYVVKDGTRLIASAVFFNKDNITSLTLPEGLLCICNLSIYGMDALNTLSLPGSLYSVGTNFCSRCPSLRSIYNYSTSPVELTTCFNQLNKDWCTLYVPKGSRAAYESAEHWQDFPIFEMNGIYTVTFEDYNGFELKTERVAEGGDAHAPADPEREGYNFLGWNRTFTNVQSDLTTTAQYERKWFIVNFIDGFDDTFITDQVVEWGLSAEAPLPPEHEGFIFTGWDVEFDIITHNLDVIAQYDINTTGIDQIRVNGDKAKKVLSEGAVFIALPDGSVFDARGTQVK